MQTAQSNCEKMNIMDFLQCNYDEVNKIWSTLEVEPLYNYECALGKILISVMRNHPSTICQIDAITNRATTNREAVLWASRLAKYFKSLKLNHNDVIGISACNSTYVLPTILAGFFNCTPVHAVNPTYDESTLTHCFGLTKPKVLFCDGRDYEKIQKSTKDLKPKIFTLTDHIAGVPSIEELLKPVAGEQSYQPENQILGSRQTVFILCSSGTTGKPKAVCVSSPSLLIENPYVNSETVSFVFSGVDWLTGLSFLMVNCIAGGTRILSNKPFSSEHFLQIVQKYKVNVTFLPPRHVAALLDNPLTTKEALKSITSLQCGGGSISENNLHRLKALLSANVDVAVGYGFTEVTSVAYNVNLNKAKAVGKPIFNLKLRIVDDNGTNRGPNEVGEILVYKKYPWNGYYGNPMETKRMIDSEGWFHSGDLGYMDNENYLYVVDRKKEILKYQGFHYWPKEIEEIISEMPDVTETCVVGVYDESNGDAAGALVVKAKDSQLKEQQVIEHVAKRSASTYKHLHAGAFFVEVIPHNANGKISRIAAKSLFISLKQQNSVG